MLPQTFGQCIRLARQVLLRRQSQNAFLDPQHAPLEAFLGNLLTLMPEVEQLSELGQQGLSKDLVTLVRKRRQELDVPNQMGEAELLQGTGVFDIRAEEIADDRSPIRFPKDLFEHF